MIRHLLLISLIASSAAFAQAQDSAILQLPQIPDSITSPTARADYLSVHYWDNFDPSSALAADSAALEQTFATYAWVLLGIDNADDLQSSMAALMSRSASNHHAYTLLHQNAKKYLYQSDSPSENLLAYSQFLQAIANDSVLDLAERQRNEFTLECIHAVFPGQPAPAFTLANGREFPASIDTPYAILVFYDHDCEQCQQLLATIDKSAYLQMLVDDGTASVTLVDIADETTDPATDDYLMRSVPSVYLIAQDGTIMLPDTSLKKALAMIAAGTPAS